MDREVVSPSPTAGAVPGRIEWTASHAEAGERLDKALTARLPGASRSYAAHLIERGLVEVNGLPLLRASQKLHEGDAVAVHVPSPQPSPLTPEDIPLTIIYEDADLLVIDKPAGMVVHPAPGHGGGTLVNAVLAHVPGMDLDMGDEARPGIVHRLDKDTSGLIVVAKRRQAHEFLSKQMASRTMTKEYLTVVRGTPRPHAGTIEAPIGRDPNDRQRMAVVQGGRAARTRYSVEQSFKGYSLLRVRLDTGRTHQIRVHMASIGHAVLGDPVYGKSTLKDAPALGLKRQFLHAHLLGFIVPSTGEYREYMSPLPVDLQGVVERLKSRG